MENNLTERLLIEVRKDSKSRRNSRFNLAAFILLRDEIYKSIDDGWSVKFIWEVLYKEEKITFGYQTFLKLVNKYRTKDMKKLKNEISTK